MASISQEGGIPMASMFKYLVSVAVWVLFLYGLAASVAGFARAFGHDQLPMVAAYFGYGIVSLFLSVLAVKIRSTLG
jgi:Na+-driven multidrug efflux pump